MKHNIPTLFSPTSSSKSPLINIYKFKIISDINLVKGIVNQFVQTYALDSLNRCVLHKWQFDKEKNVLILFEIFKDDASLDLRFNNQALTPEFLASDQYKAVIASLPAESIMIIGDISEDTKSKVNAWHDANVSSGSTANLKFYSKDISGFSRFIEDHPLKIELKKREVNKEISVSNAHHYIRTVYDIVVKLLNNVPSSHPQELLKKLNLAAYMTVPDGDEYIFVSSRDQSADALGEEVTNETIVNEGMYHIHSSLPTNISFGSKAGKIAAKAAILPALVAVYDSNPVTPNDGKIRQINYMWPPNNPKLKTSLSLNIVIRDVGISIGCGINM